MTAPVSSPGLWSKWLNFSCCCRNAGNRAASRQKERPEEIPRAPSREQSGGSSLEIAPPRKQEERAHHLRLSSKSNIDGKWEQKTPVEDLKIVLDLPGNRVEFTPDQKHGASLGARVQAVHKAIAEVNGLIRKLKAQDWRTNPDVDASLALLAGIVALSNRFEEASADLKSLLAGLLEAAVQDGVCGKKSIEQFDLVPHPIDCPGLKALKRFGAEMTTDLALCRKVEIPLAISIRILSPRVTLLGNTLEITADQGSILRVKLDDVARRAWEERCTRIRSLVQELWFGNMLMQDYHKRQCDEGLLKILEKRISEHDDITRMYRKVGQEIRVCMLAALSRMVEAGQIDKRQAGRLPSVEALFPMPDQTALEEMRARIRLQSSGPTDDDRNEKLRHTVEMNG